MHAFCTSLPTVTPVENGQCIRKACWTEATNDDKQGKRQATLTNNDLLRDKAMLEPLTRIATTPAFLVTMGRHVN